MYLHIYVCRNEAGTAFRICREDAGDDTSGRFASNICKDCGYQTIAGQIEMFAKLSILALGMPVLMAFMETIGELL